MKDNSWRFVEFRHDLWMTHAYVDDKLEDKGSIKSGTKDCEGDKDCEDHKRANDAARATTIVALVLAALACFPILGFACCDCGTDETKSKRSAGLSAALAVGGIIGLAGAANYKSVMDSVVKPHGNALAGCVCSIAAGVIAVVAGAVGVALHIKSPPAGDATKDTELPNSQERV